MQDFSIKTFEIIVGYTKTSPDKNLVARLRFLRALSGKYIVLCQGDVQLGGLIQGFPALVPLRLRLVSLYYSLKV